MRSVGERESLVQRVDGPLRMQRAGEQGEGVDTERRGGERAVRVQPVGDGLGGGLGGAGQRDVRLKRAEIERREAGGEQGVVDALAELEEARVARTDADPERAGRPVGRKRADALHGQQEGGDAHGAQARAERIEQGWVDIARRTEVLASVKHRVVEGKVDIGTVYRLQAVAPSRAEAEKLCAALKADGVECQVK